MGFVWYAGDGSQWNILQNLWQGSLGKVPQIKKIHLDLDFILETFHKTYKRGLLGKDPQN